MNATATLATPLARRERWFAVGLLLFFVAVSVQHSFKVRDDDHHSNRSAILRWREQILDLDHGVNVFETHNYPNPPIMVLLLAPVVHLPPLVCSLCWFYLKVAMAVAAIVMTLRLVESPDRPFRRGPRRWRCCSVCGPSWATSATATSTCSSCSWWWRRCSPTATAASRSPACCWGWPSLAR